MGEILLVEDDVLIADLVEEALNETGFDVEIAHSASDALSRIEGGPHCFAVLVTDVNLGEALTGFDVARRAREVNPAVKVVYVTGLPSNIHAAEEEALMFPKPFDPAELAAQVRAIAAK
jgi:DNA-binding response OmpR family regulator